MKRLALFAFFTLSAIAVLANPKPDAILGIWQNGSGKGHIQIFKLGDKYFGKIVWLRDGKDDQGRDKVDRKNSNAELRDRPLIGLTILSDFRYSGQEYKGGRIYNPSDGKEYKAYLTLKDPNTLSVRGYMGFSWIGKTDTWKRVK